MNPETIDILSSDDLIEIREYHFSRLTELYSGKKPERVFCLNGIGAGTSVDAYKEPEKWVEGALDNLATVAEKGIDRKLFRPLVIEYGVYGVHFIDRIFRANVYFHGDQWWVDLLENPVGTLEYPDLEKDETWNLAKRAAKAFVDTGVKAPLFGLPTLSSALNIGVNLYGEKLLISMLTDPEAARHDLQIINDLICDLHRWYLENIPLQQLQMVVAGHRTQPRGYGQLCGCTCHLLSAGLYRDFIAPLDDQLLSVYPNGGMIHLCGIHTQHIPVWREMKSVRAIQVNDRASEDLETYFNELRDDQIIYLNTTPTMTPDRGIEITNGRRLVLVGEFPEYCQ
ncbi:hypothetical protein GF312_01945 [Candidatus Poribacteria bacterium]|nr:hypothetical protein [Candidatus Poribacteria bacterium]